MDLKNNGENLPSTDTPDKQPDLSFEINNFYTLSGRNRSKRTNYNINFTPFKQDPKEISSKKRSHSINGSLMHNILHPFAPAERPKIILKNKGRLSVEDRYRIMNRNSNYKKETNNLSVKDLELLQHRNSLMLDNLKKNF